MERYVFTAEKKAALEGLRQPFAIYQFVNKRVVTLVLSEGFCELFGYTDREQAYYDMDHDMYKDTHPDDKARIANAAIVFATEGGRYEVIYRTRKKDTSDYVVVHAMGEHVYTEDGVRLAHVWYTDEGTYVEDSAETRFEITHTLSNALHEQSMIKASRYDFLTGLPSMTYFFELAEAEKEKILKSGGEPALLYIDFSGMKFFNNKHGFAVGNQMLQSFAQLLSAAFSNENCCRIGSDHFAVISPESGLEEKLNGIFAAFGKLYDGKTPPVHVGIYPHRIEDVPASSACDRAKMACGVLKGSYVSGFSYYTAELRENAVNKHYFIENIDTAIREGWIKVYLQPIIRAVNGRVCDVEALSRWIDPEKGIFSPASYIPVLEEARLIYKLDLYVIDQVLEAIKTQKDEGFHILPHSINLSRDDFDACDIVEEIRKRVDAAGIDRDRITIEITESMIGRDFEFIKAQVKRFRELGFPVWMDDFGSGYSSLDVLHSIQFDLVKFDMSFMRMLKEGGDGKVILTELMRLATSLGLDTVCEGVETESQSRFLQEIGCSKLQGYYYCKPLPFDTIRDMYCSKSLIENEDPEESGYYESIGKVSLYDLGIIAGDSENGFHNYFDTIPISILEVWNGGARYVRSNRSYRELVKRLFHVDVMSDMADFISSSGEVGDAFVSAIKQSLSTGNRVFFDQKLPDGSIAHSLVRRVSVNPVTGAAAIAIAVLSVTDPDESTTFADIARALAADYYNLYVIDLDTDQYIEYSSQIGREELFIERHGKGFFESAKRDTMTRIYEEDREPFLKWFSKENVLHELNTQGVFTTTYRLIDTGTPMYVNMKITRMRGGNRLILGVSNIDAHMKQKERYEELQKERNMLVRVMALSDGYLTMYIVDLETGSYVVCSSSDDFESLGASKGGEDFFGQAYIDVDTYCYPEDRKRFREQVTRENVLREIKLHGSFSIDYRLMIKGVPRPVTLKAALFRDGDEEKLVVGLREGKNAPGTDAQKKIR